MSYTPTQWSRGDVVTSEKLNKLEQGVAEAGGGGSGGGALMVGVEQSTGTLSKTWKEIHDAALVGPVMLLIVGTDSVNHVYANAVYASDGDYEVYFGENAYATDNENGYPVFS